MLDFSNWIDLPLIWGCIIAFAVLVYSILDGFDLGCGIIFPFAPSDNCRNKIMNSIAPFWDGNETWLVLGGGGLFAAFPLAYSIIMPALYLPIMFMLMGLIFRGVAFEFRFKTEKKYRRIWDISFHIGSLVASFMQGVILGNFIYGISVTGRQFDDAHLSWANGFAITTGVSLVFGYALLGSCWLIMKTEGETQLWIRKIAGYVMFYVFGALVIVCIATPLADPRVTKIWFSMPNFVYLLPLPIMIFYVFFALWQSLNATIVESKPFLLTILLFILTYIGFGISIYPWVVPYQFTIWEAAAAPTSLSILLIGTVLFIPIILSYTAYSYHVFRGKSSENEHY